jgi:four helix bundle protein
VLANRITRYDEPRGHLADQLRRASSSIVLNIAEGAGEWKPLEKARFYRIALRSGTECAGILALLERLSGGKLSDERALLYRIVSMLSKLALAKPARRER